MIEAEKRKHVDETLRWYISMREEEWSKNGGNKDGRKWKNLWTVRPGLSAEHLDTRIPKNLCKYTGPDSVVTGTTDDDIDSLHSTGYSPTISRNVIPAQEVVSESIVLATSKELEEISSLLSFMQDKKEMPLSQSLIDILNQTAEAESIAAPPRIHKKNTYRAYELSLSFFDSEMNVSMETLSSSSEEEEEEEEEEISFKKKSFSRKLKKVFSFLSGSKRSVSTSPRKRRLANLRRVTSEKILGRSTGLKHHRQQMKKTSFTPRGDSSSKRL